MTYTQLERLDPETSTLTISLDADLYPRDALYGAAYVFIDRAYMLLDREGTRFLVHLRGKQPLTREALTALAGEFENELLAQTLRHRVVRTNHNLIEQITALAITGAAGPAIYDDENDAASQPSAEAAEDFMQDPLGLGTPWEEKKRDD